MSAHLDGPPHPVAVIQEAVVPLHELVLLAESAQGQQALQALVEVAKNGGEGQAV